MQVDAEKGKVFGRTVRAKLRIKEGTFVRLVDVGGREEIVWCDLHGHPSKGHFGVVWLAGDRAASMDILPSSRDDVAKAVRTAAHSWARIRKIGIYAVEEDPVAILRSFALPRLGKDLREVGPDRKPLGKLQYAPAGWFNEQSYFLRSSTIRDLVRSKSKRDKDMKGLVHEFCRALEEKGALVRGG